MRNESETGIFGKICNIKDAIAGSLILLISMMTMTGYASDAEAVQVHFANSCSVEVQADFDHAVTLLHSFEYVGSSRIFGQIIDRDPTCAMARWGAAMSIWHPLWAPPGKAELATGARLLADAKAMEATPREAAYIDALTAFFAGTDTGTDRARAGAHERRMSELHANYPGDTEAAVFYALAVRGTADPRDKSFGQQLKAAEILNRVLKTQPNHPGVLHYLIHCFDSPGIADRGLDAAMRYADAAPDSAHAQHMPSHIFTRLGLWERSLASNHHSTKSAADYTLRANLSGQYDEGLHSIDYLMYALLQTARDDEARALLAKLRNIGITNTENFKVAYTHAAAPARYALERRQWKEASALTLGPAHFFDWDGFGWAVAIHHFARGIGAARSGQTGQARREWTAIKELQEALPATTLPYWREEVRVELDAVMSWVLLAEGKTREALNLASAAADREDAVDKSPVTPGEVLPARELYADMLSEVGDDAAALAQYRTVLTGSPNRLNALLGAARAAGRLDNAKLAAEYLEVIRTQTRFGNPERADLTQAQ